MNFIKSQLEKVIESGGLASDINGKSSIDKEGMTKILVNKEACTALQEVGVDVCGLVDNMDQIFQDGEDDTAGRSLELEEFADFILGLCGSNTATVKDIVDLRKHVKAGQKRFGRRDAQEHQVRARRGAQERNP